VHSQGPVFYLNSTDLVLSPHQLGAISSLLVNVHLLLQYESPMSQCWPDSSHLSLKEDPPVQYFFWFIHHLISREFIRPLLPACLFLLLFRPLRVWLDAYVVYFSFNLSVLVFSHGCHACLSVPLSSTPLRWVPLILFHHHCHNSIASRFLRHGPAR